MSVSAPVSVLYEDNHLLVVEKPVNMPVQRDASGDLDLLTQLKAYVKEKYGKPGEVYLGLVHRLDRPVGGVMVFARTSKAAERLSAQFKAREAKKRYAAVVCGRPLPEAALSDWLYKDEQSHSSSVVAEGTPGAKLANLAYALLAQGEARALLDVTLGTGRPHQIRVQLANAQLPIAGDQRYNEHAGVGEQIQLWAYALTLRHPTLGETMTFFSAPQGAGFAAFPAQIALLPAFACCRGVYMDETLLVADKNAGVETETELLPELRSLLCEVYPVHRLDANTEGLVAFARTEEAEKRLLERFRTHALTKVYHAVVRGAPPSEGRLIHYGAKDAEAGYMRVVEKDAPGAVEMRLSYRVLAAAGSDETRRSLVEIDLETGRTHQIRAQFAAIGHPVLGDDRYGDRAFNKALHARSQRLLSKRLILDGRRFESLRELSL